MPVISVIVPVYKVEYYLSVCIQSILNQSFTDFELILIDDGSPDQCGVICDEFASKDNRIRVIHQENRGLSGARNAGMDIAKGQYITFVDSDDILADNYLLELYSVLQEENADISVCSSCDLSEEKIQNNKLYASQTDNKMAFDRVAAVSGIYNGNIGVSFGATCKLYKRELIAGLRFPEGRLHEDQAFTPLAVYRSNKIVVTEANIYFYRIREESITHHAFSVKRYDDLWAIDSCIAFFKAQNEQEILEAALKKRQRLLSVYAIYAWRDKVAVPEEYSVSLWSAVRYLQKNVSDEKYQYYLAQIHPKLALAHEYVRKIKSILHLK